MSATNHGTATGRLAADPRVFTNSDGSKKVMFTVMVDRQFRNRETGERLSDAIPLEAWVAATTEGTGPFGYLGKGDQVTVSYAVRSSTYPDKTTGEIQYGLALTVTDLQFLESRATSQQRRIAHLKSALEGPQAAQQAPAAPKASTRRQKAAAAA